MTETTAVSSDVGREDDSPRPSKQRRTDQACSQCRHRKQRCLRPTTSPAASPGLLAKCCRCQKLKIECSFELPVDDEAEGWLPEAPVGASTGRIEQLLADLQESMTEHSRRMARVERLVEERPASLAQERSPSAHGIAGVQPFESVPTWSTASTSMYVGPQEDVVAGFTMATVEIGAPMTTLRSLRNQLEDEHHGTAKGIDNMARAPSVRDHHDMKRLPMWDPIVQGHLMMDEAKQAINIFFDHCHAHAPVMDDQIRASCLDLRYTCPVLFLAVCTIACRFWPSHRQSTPIKTLHPRYAALTALYDIAISRLLLNPSPGDVTLDSIRALLLYAQWMPLSSQADDAGSAASRPPKSRYSDISAWAVLGLAMRYASYLGLDRNAVAAFRDGRQIQPSDMSRLRVWHNLLTCDCNLMLTSGLPATLDPGPAAQVAAAFGSHALAQQPADSRVMALVELVVIAHRAMTRADGHLSIAALKKVNTELDDWEAAWTPRLRHTSAQHCSLPFASVRWYRLALNSASLSPLLTSPTRIPASNRISLLGALEASLTSCCRILMSVTDSGMHVVWDLEAQDPATFGHANRFTVDAEVISRLIFSVDYAWISHTFAATFLVICYLKGAIDDDLQIISFSSTTRGPPLPARRESLLARLITLACDIFDAIYTSSGVHPATDYRAIVRNAAALIRTSSSPLTTLAATALPPTIGPGQMNEYLPPAPAPFLNENDNSASATALGGDSALQSLLDMMAENGMEWSANLMSSATGGMADGQAGFDFGLNDNPFG